MKCKYCDKEIPANHTDLKCDNCWEIETRIHKNLVVAKKIYKAVKKMMKNNKKRGL